VQNVEVNLALSFPVSQFSPFDYFRILTSGYRSWSRASSLTTIPGELAQYQLDPVGVQEVKWKGSGTEQAGEYTFFYGKRNENHELGTGLFVHKRNHISS
jgi:hypothetical protein